MSDWSFWVWSQMQKWQDDDHGQTAVTPWVSKRSSIVCQLMRKWPYLSLDLLPRITFNEFYGLSPSFQVFYNSAWYSICNQCFPHIYFTWAGHPGISMASQAYLKAHFSISYFYLPVGAVVHKPMGWQLAWTQHWPLQREVYLNMLI